MEKVLLYGAGDIGRRFLSSLRVSIYSNRNIKIIGFIDRNPSLKNECIDGVPIFSPDAIIGMDFDRIIITTWAPYGPYKMLTNTMGISTQKVDAHTARMCFNSMEKILKRRIPAEPLIIPSLVVCVGQACTLKCKDCGNLSPYAPDHTKAYPVQSIIQNLKTITEYALIDILQIQGGEPFIYRNLNQILSYAVKSDRIMNCQIATNGTVLPKVDLALLQDEKVKIRISNYPNAKNIADELLELFQGNNISSSFYNFSSGEDLWYLCDAPTSEPILDDCHEQEKFELCEFNSCFTLEDSKICYCSRGVIAQSIQGFTAKKGDYLFVDDKPDFKERLYEYIRFPKPMEACRHCNGTFGSELVEPAIQLER